MDGMTKIACPWSRSAENLGNSVELQHVNLRVPNQLHATAFYISALGFARDPYLLTGIENMWANVGVSQFHLPTGEAQVLRGTVGLIIEDRELLLHRLQTARRWLDGTKYSFKEHNDHVAVTCPWGNRFRVHAPDAERFGRVRLGIPYVEFDVKPGAAAGIAKFYKKIVNCPVKTGKGVTNVLVARDQYLVFKETDAKQPKYDGHHIQLALQDFGGAHAKLSKLGLISQEDSQHQYRFIKVIDPDTAEVLFEVEHEIRSMTHPLFMRKLVNRNPAINNMNFEAGHEAYAYTMPPA
jgi:hypothetical protein